MLGVVLAAIGSSIALAQGDLGGKLRSGSDITIGSGETVDSDLYAFGGTVTVDGTVNGDLVVSGGTLTVNGTVGGDLIAAGGTIRIGGEVAGDVRAAGGTITILGDVTEDALIAGGQVELASGGHVGEDMLVNSGTLSLSGTVDGSVSGSTGTYSRTGTIAGEDGIDVRPPMVWQPTTTNAVLDAIRQFIAVFVIGLLALWIAPRLTSRAEWAVRARPLVAAAAGFAGLIGFVVLVIVIAVAAVLVAVALGLIGFGGLAVLDVFAGIVALGGLILAFVFVAGFLADAIVGLGLAALFARAFGWDASVPADTGVPPDTGVTETTPTWRLDARTIGLLALGVAVIVILTSLPIIGGFAKLVVVLLGLGAVLWVVWRRRPARPVAPPPAPA